MSDLKSIDQLSSELNDASTAVGNLQTYDEATKALEIEEEEEWEETWDQVDLDLIDDN